MIMVPSQHQIRQILLDLLDLCVELGDFTVPDGLPLDEGCSCAVEVGFGMEPEDHVVSAAICVYFVVSYIVALLVQGFVDETLGELVDVADIQTVGGHVC